MQTKPNVKHTLCTQYMRSKKRAHLDGLEVQGLELGRNRGRLRAGLSHGRLVPACRSAYEIIVISMVNGQVTSCRREILEKRAVQASSRSRVHRKRSATPLAQRRPAAEAVAAQTQAELTITPPSHKRYNLALNNCAPKHWR